MSLLLIRYTTDTCYFDVIFYTCSVILPFICTDYAIFLRCATYKHPNNGKFFAGSGKIIEYTLRCM